MPSFLCKNHGIVDSPRVEYGITVDVDEIVKVLFILTGNHVACPVGISKGIQKGLQGSLQKLYKGIFGFVFAASTENGMLENVRDSRAIGGRCSECNAKDLQKIDSAVGIAAGEFIGPFPPL